MIESSQQKEKGCSQGPVLVTDGDARSTLAVVRALGRAGIPVTVCAPGRKSLAGSSRWAADRVVYPSPLEQPYDFRAFMRKLVELGSYSLLVPMTDISLQLLSEDTDFYSERVPCAFPKADLVRRAQDKSKVLTAARRVGIDVPETMAVGSVADVEAIAKEIKYPVVIKPHCSWTLCNEGWVSGRVRYAKSAQELVEFYATCEHRSPLPMIQECLEGEGRGVFLLIWRGNVKAAFCHRRIREKPPSGGVSVYCESVAADAELIEKCVFLLREFEWQGPAMVEFKVDSRTGKPKLMEINGRFWGSLQLAIDSGVNFPLLLYWLANGQDIPEQQQYRVGVKNRWLLGDVQRLIMAMTSDSRGASKTKLCREFFPIFEPGGHFEDLRFDDLGPFFQQFLSAFKTRRSRARAAKDKTPGRLGVVSSS